MRWPVSTCTCVPYADTNWLTTCSSDAGDDDDDEQREPVAAASSAASHACERLREAALPPST